MYFDSDSNVLGVIQVYSVAHNHRIVLLRVSVYLRTSELSSTASAFHEICGREVVGLAEAVAPSGFAMKIKENTSVFEVMSTSLFAMVVRSMRLSVSRTYTIFEERLY